MYLQTLSFDLNSTSSKQIEIFYKKRLFFMVVFLYVHNFIKKILLKLLFQSIFKISVTPKLWQTKNVLQLIIESFICAPISQHNARLGCKPSLILKLSS